MTMPRYLRRARVEVVHAGNLLLSVDEGLRIVFSMKKGAQSDGPSSEVKIYNLSSASGSYIINKRDVVRVQAGYGDGTMLGLVGEMEIRNVTHERAGLDRITTMTLGASDTAKTESVWSQSYEGDVLLPVIVADIVDHMGLLRGPTGILPNVPVSDFSELGKAYDVLRDLLEPWGVEPHIEDGYVKFASLAPAATPSPVPVAVPRLTSIVPVAIPTPAPTPDFTQGPSSSSDPAPTPRPAEMQERVDAPTHTVQTPLAVLDEPGGLIGSPSATEKGARAKMLLITDLQLDQLVDIRSEMLNGMFKISSIVHRGDTWSGEFVTEIEGSPFEPKTPVGSAGPSPYPYPTPVPVAVPRPASIVPVAIPTPSPLPGGRN